MFPAPPFSMFRYGIREVRPRPGIIRIRSFWHPDPRLDSEEVNEYLIRELRLVLDRIELDSSFIEDDVPIMETASWRQALNN